MLQTVGPISPSIRNGSSTFRGYSLAPSSWFWYFWHPEMHFLARWWGGDARHRTGIPGYKNKSVYTYLLTRHIYQNTTSTLTVNVHTCNECLYASHAKWIIFFPVAQQPSSPPSGPWHPHSRGFYEVWNFNFGNTPLDWIQELWSDAPMQQEGWVLPLPTYIMGAVHHEMGVRSSQLIVSRCRDSV